MSLPKEKQTRPIYDGLTSGIQAELADVRYGDFAVDQIEAVVKSEGAEISLAPLAAMRKNNLLRVNGSFQLPPPNEKLINQPADLQFICARPN